MISVKHFPRVESTSTKSGVATFSHSAHVSIVRPYILYYYKLACFLTLSFPLMFL